MYNVDKIFQLRIFFTVFITTQSTPLSAQYINFWPIIVRVDRSNICRFFIVLNISFFFIYVFSIAYIGPSVTTYNYMNPGYRTYDVDGGSPDSTWVLYQIEI